MSNKIYNLLVDKGAIMTGHFILTSGLHSNKYIQCAKLLSFPKIAETICCSLCEKINKNFNKIDIILSPAIGGIVVGYEVGRQLNKETIFAERFNDKLVLRRGFEIPINSNVLVVEDVITTGKSALECSKIIRDYKANTVGYACIIDRSDEKLLIKDNIISQIKIKIDTFTDKNLPDDIKSITAIKPGSRN